MKTQKCISEICICGRHHCPKKYVKDIFHPHPIPHTQLPDSEYIEKYRRFAFIPPRSALKPRTVTKHSDQKMESVTTASDAYRAFPCEPPKPRPKPVYRPPSKTVLDTSTYKGDYCDDYRMIPVPDSFKPHIKYHPPSVPIDDKTVNTEAYRCWNPDDVRLCRGMLTKPIHTFPPPGSRPFLGVSTFQDDYRAPEGVTVVRGKGKETTLCSEGVHHMDTTHQVDFTEKPIYIRRPFKPKHVLPDLPSFKSTTIYQNDYSMPLALCPAESCRPHLKYNPPDYPMDCDSVQKKDYRMWRIEGRVSPPWAKKQSYQMPSIPMHDSTVYSESYPKPSPGFDRMPSKRPIEGLKIGHGRTMECQTCHMNDYKKWEVELTQSHKRPEIYKPPRQKMLNESIYTTQYRGQFIPPSESMKPKVNLQIRAGPMADTTVYQDSYRCPPSGVCPASILHASSEEGRPLFDYIGSTCGHEYYVRESGERAT